ncbi:MAG: hypothetical protein HYS81_00585 [Candidatus Aenigmatarchaeota archaeon]|nr:MAG: hypothetical protein HYS81_00585 [Candidatus Aenigmarchaeota archaeon]
MIDAFTLGLLAASILFIGYGIARIALPITANFQLTTERGRGILLGQGTLLVGFGVLSAVSSGLGLPELKPVDVFALGSIAFVTASFMYGLLNISGAANRALLLATVSSLEFFMAALTFLFLVEYPYVESMFRDAFIITASLSLMLASLSFFDVVLMKLGIFPHEGKRHMASKDT